MPYTTVSYSDIEQNVNKLEEYFSKQGIPIVEHSELRNVINRTRHIVRDWRCRQKGLIMAPSFSRSRDLIDMAWCGLLAEAVLLLAEDEGNKEILLKEYLPIVAKHPFMPSSPTAHENESAKKKTYELFFVSWLRPLGYEIKLSNEPDNIIRMPSGEEIGVHFKQPCLEKNIVRNFNKALKQVKVHNSEIPKIISISLDDIFDHDKFRQLTKVESNKVEDISKRIDAYIKTHLKKIENIAKDKQKEFTQLKAVAFTLSTACYLNTNFITTASRALILPLVHVADPWYAKMLTIQEDINRIP